MKRVVAWRARSAYINGFNCTVERVKPFEWVVTIDGRTHGAKHLTRSQARTWAEDYARNHARTGARAVLERHKG